jgi:hypothetical protein
MPRALWIALLFALCALAAAASPARLPLQGPLRVDNAYPPLLPFLALPAEGPRSLEPRELELDLALNYGNSFHWDPQVLYPDLDLLIDMEVWRLSLCAAWGLAPGLSVRAGLSLVGEYGGFLDPLIQGIHAFFGLPNGDRDQKPDNRYGFRIVHDGQVLVDLDEAFWALGDLVLAAKWTLRDGQAGGFGAALQAAFSLPIGSSRLFTSGGTLNACLAAVASWRRSAFAVYGGAGYLLLAEPPWGQVLGFRPHNLSFFASLEWAPRGRVAWLLQADGRTLPYLHPHPWLSGLSGTISFGARFRLGPRLLLESYLSEELFSYATLDIAAGCGLRMQL